MGYPMTVLLLWCIRYTELLIRKGPACQKNVCRTISSQIWKCEGFPQENRISNSKRQQEQNTWHLAQERHSPSSPTKHIMYHQEILLPDSLLPNNQTRSYSLLSHAVCSRTRGYSLWGEKKWDKRSSVFNILLPRLNGILVIQEVYSSIFSIHELRHGTGKIGKHYLRLFPTATWGCSLDVW